jgi:hypothetical protein
MSGIVKNVADNLFEIGKSAVKGTAGAVADIASESIEQVVSAPTQVAPTKDNGYSEYIKNKQIEEKKTAEARRLSQVKGELASYTERKKQLDQKIAQEKAMEKREKEKGIFEKKKKDSFTQNLLKKLSAGSHGETDRQKE